MKRVLIAPKTALVPLDRPQRVCTRLECGKALTATQKKFCSHSCRNIVLSPGNSGGAPEKYLPEYASSKMKEYLTFCEKGNEPTLIPTKSSYIVLPNAELPSLIGYAQYLKFSRQTLENWATRHSDFARALDMLKNIQRSFLINNGLSGRYNSGMARFLLGVNHGMIERKEVDNTHKLLGVVKYVYQRADELEREMYGLKT